MIITAMICLAGFVAGVASTAYAAFWLMSEPDPEKAEYTARIRKLEENYD